MEKSTRHFLLFFISLLFTVCIKSHGQDFDHYQTLRSSGQVPEKFLTSSTQKYEADVQKLSKKEKARLRRLKKQFYLESAFDLNELLLSGRLVFNDPVSVYVNKVMDEILKNDRNLRSKIEIYVLKSTSFNAFTHQDGTIYITVGLLAQLQNESELALILCHELTHYVKQHSIQRVVENDKIRTGKGTYRRANEDEKMAAASRFSQKEESEADLAGLDYFLKTDYDPLAAVKAFDLMEFQHLTFSELPYDKGFLETANLKFPPSYFLKNTSTVEANDDDSLSTHPAAKLRREAVIVKLKGHDFSNKKTYRIGETEFLNAQKICRYEMCNIYLHYMQFPAALYNAYLLLKENPKSTYLKKCIAKSLYGYCKFEDNDKISDIQTSYIDIEGSAQQVYFLLYSLKAPEINALALEYLYNLKLQYPDDKEIASLTEDLMQEIPQYYESRNFFSTSAKPMSLDSLFAKDSAYVLPVDDDDDSIKPPKKEIVIQKSKYEGIANKVSNDEDEDTSGEDDPVKLRANDKNYFIKYAFVELLKNTAFVADFDKAIIKFKENEKEEAYEESKEYKKLEKKRERKEKRRGIALGLNKILIINPFYYKIDESSENPIKLVASEAAQKKLNNCIEKNVSLAGLDHNVLDMNNLSSNSTNVFNDLANLNYFISEKTEAGDMHYVNYMTDDIQGIIKKYNTNYIDWAGVICNRVHNDYKKAYYNTIFTIFSLLYFPIAPYALYNDFRTHYNTYVINVVYDLGNGEVKNKGVTKIKFKDREDVLNSVFYDVFLQFKKPVKS